MEKRTKFSLNYYIIIFLTFLAIDSIFFSGHDVREISYKEFRDCLERNEIESVVITPNKIHGLMNKPGVSKKVDTNSTPGGKDKSFEPKMKYTPWRVKIKEYEKKHDAELKRQFMVIPLEDHKLLEDLQAHGIDYRGKLESDWLKNFFLNWIIPFAFIFFIWGIIFKRMGGGAGVMNVGKSKAKIYAEDPKNRVTFNDVAGIDEAVEEVREVVDFLKNSAKYTRLGAKLPKGVLLVGPPGTGKTLLAKAVAGEAGVPFFSLSGSDFVEMFVGVGASRVRDLFSEAKAKAPCIVFIDEIDAIGKSRGHGVYTAGFDERENTLNQMLSEMDGFDPQVSVIIMGATNRVSVLDPALLRPGRFDRQILVDRPDMKGRMDIFRIHTSRLVLARDVDLQKLAAETPGFAGAEIANVCNEAALLASRNNKPEIAMKQFQDAIERVIAGLEKKNKIINPRERRVIAYHESGHAIVGHFTPGADPVRKVTIVPHGIGALGYTLQTPLEDRYLMSRSELVGKIKGLLGGRAAEEVVFSAISTGASNDLEKATKIAKDMIQVYGMSRRMPNISLSEQDERDFLAQGAGLSHHSEKVMQMIDEEISEVIQTCYKEAKQLLQKEGGKLEKLAQTLLEKEVIEESDIQAILGLRPDVSVFKKLGE